MSCGGGHLGFPIGIKNRNLVKNHPMIIHLQFGFSQFISFRKEDLWNFGQSEHIGPGSHGQATGKLYNLRLWVECTLYCNLQWRAWTHAVLVIGLYELLDISELESRIYVYTLNMHMLISLPRVSEH
jgi:hypothetical protein